MSSVIPGWKQPLDVPLVITSEEEDFFKIITGIEDWEELKVHITTIQIEAYTSIYSYPCIRSFNFCRFKVANHFAYDSVKTLGQNNEGICTFYPCLLPRLTIAYDSVKTLGQNNEGIFLDLGCCFGTDVRKVVLDGWNPNRILGTDLQAGFIELGYKLFKDKNTSKIPFIVGDIFSTNFYDPTSSPISNYPSLSTLTNLNSLHSKVIALHAGSFFHLFDEVTQEILARIVFSLMDQKKGSIIFGSHIGMEVAGIRTNLNRTREDKSTTSTTPPGRGMFCHSPESWKELWKKVAGDRVIVDARMIDRHSSKIAPPSPDGTLGGAKMELLLWSVTWI